MKVKEFVEFINEHISKDVSVFYYKKDLRSGSTGHVLTEEELVNNYYNDDLCEWKIVSTGESDSIFVEFTSMQGLEVGRRYDKTVKEFLDEIPKDVYDNYNITWDIHSSSNDESFGANDLYTETLRNMFGDYVVVESSSDVDGDKKTILGTLRITKFL